MAQTFNVFISNELLQLSSSGYLTGCVSLSSGLICVLGITPHVANSHRIIGYFSQTQTSKVQETYLDALKSREQCTEKEESSCILLLKSDSSNDITCEIFVSFNGTTQEARAVLILFKPQDVLQSYLYMKEQQLEYGEKSERNRETSLKNINCNDSLGEQVADMINTFSQLSSLPKEIVPYKRDLKPVSLKGLKNVIWQLSELFLWTLSNIWTMSSRKIVRNFFSYLNVFQLLYDKSERCHKVASHHKGLVFNQFLSYNVCAQHICDSLAGMLILYLILHFGLINIIASSTLDWADDVAARLKNLTQWLMGAPAGLKLNAELTNFFGHFYIYHIYVWTGYLVLLRTALPWLIACGVWSGVLGFSFQLCFIQDTLALLTLHIYCFYVYAARIFNIQVYALGSLWKLFRGKKWNVLRRRVDSAEYDTDQLFVGTLMFTVLLFLLPTTVLYYAVFTSLYAIVLSGQGLLSHIITFINDLPIHTLMLRILKPKLIAGATFFKIENSKTDSPTPILSMETSQLPLTDVIALTAPYLSGPRKPKYTWGKLLSNIATGQLIYPWMDTPLKKL